MTGVPTSLTYHYKMPPSMRGRETHFETVSVELYDPIPPDKRLRRLHITRDYKETVISNVPQLSCTSTNTDRKEVESRGMRHKEGGWPATVDCEELEDIAKYCKRAERDEGYIAAAARLVQAMDKQLRLNTAIDIYPMYFDDDKEGTGASWATGASEGDTLGQSPGGYGEETHRRRNTLSKSADDNLFGTATDSSTRSGSGGAGLPSSTSLSYKDPATIAQLCCTAKFGVDTVEGAIPIACSSNGLFGAGPVAAQCAWTCGSESTTLVVAYQWGTGLKGGSGLRSAGNPMHNPGTKNTCAAVWNIHNPGAPSVVLESPVAGGATCVACSSKDTHIITGGSETGVVLHWDTRQGARPLAVSDHRWSHQGPVVEVRYLLSKGLECFSVGQDGRVLFWDLRNLDRPLENETVFLTPPTAVTASFGSASAAGPLGGTPSLGAIGAPTPASPTSPKDLRQQPPGDTPVFSGTCVDYDPMVGGSQKYTVGTAEGLVLGCSRRGKSPAEKVTGSFEAHYGVVFDICRNPSNPKYFATVGDWGFKLFGDELRVPFCASPCGASYATCGRWLPHRPGVLCVGNTQGALEFWDVVHSVTAPAMRLALTGGDNDPLTHLACHPGGKMVAACSKSGNTYLAQLPSVLYTTQTGERGALTQLFEEEYNRVRALTHARSRSVAPPKTPLQASMAPSIDEAAPDTRSFAAPGAELQAQLHLLGEMYLSEVMPSASSTSSVVSTSKPSPKPPFTPTKPKEAAKPRFVPTPPPKTPTDE